MRLSINTLNAAFIINEVIMSGGRLNDAVSIARNEPLLNKVVTCQYAHRATVVRLVKLQWAERTAQIAAKKARQKRHLDADALVAAEYPEEWAKAKAIACDNDRREACRLLRRRYDHNCGGAAVFYANCVGK